LQGIGSMFTDFKTISLGSATFSGKGTLEFNSAQNTHGQCAMRARAWLLSQAMVPGHISRRGAVRMASRASLLSATIVAPKELRATARMDARGFVVAGNARSAQW
jgi:hypothetical protein